MRSNNMSENTMSENTMSENTTSTKELGGVGIMNIKERLTLFFGEAFSMEIETETNAYTKVYLHLPLKEEGHANS